MRMVTMVALLLLTALCGGCMPSSFRSTAQPYLNADRLDRGLVIVLTGIEGRSTFNEGIASGLAKGGCPYAIEIYDWTSSWVSIVNQETIQKNKNTACEIAGKILRYHMAYPDRPVILAGQSGGAAMAIWTAECLNGQSVDGIVLLAASISPGYRLDRALAASRRGIVSFHSDRDFLMLGLGTSVVRTMDGNFGTSAGMRGFDCPPGTPPEYLRLYQIPYNSSMSATGNVGLHLTSSSEAFVARYIEPIVMNTHWTKESIQMNVDAANGTGAVKTQ